MEHSLLASQMRRAATLAPAWTWDLLQLSILKAVHTHGGSGLPDFILNDHCLHKPSQALCPCARPHYLQHSPSSWKASGEQIASSGSFHLSIMLQQPTPATLTLSASHCPERSNPASNPDSLQIGLQSGQECDWSPTCSSNSSSKVKGCPTNSSRGKKSLSESMCSSSGLLCSNRMSYPDFLECRSSLNRGMRSLTNAATITLSEMHGANDCLWTSDRCNTRDSIDDSYSTERSSSSSSTRRSSSREGTSGFNGGNRPVWYPGSQTQRVGSGGDGIALQPFRSSRIPSNAARNVSFSSACDTMASTSSVPNQHKTGRDKIQIKGARFYGYHGVLPAENSVGQPFVCNVTLECDLQRAGVTDDLSHTVSYAEAFLLMKRIVEGPPCQLLEKVGERIAVALLQMDPNRISGVRVAISKSHIPALSAAVDSVGVEVYRTQEDVPPAASG